MTAHQNFSPISSQDRGQSLLEFALVISVLVVTTLMITEFGRALWVKNVITQAAREGCRAAVVSSSGTYGQVATNRCNDFLSLSGMGSTDPNPATVLVSLETEDGDQILRVKVSRTFTFIPTGPLPTGPGATGPFITNLGQFTLESEAIMRTETF